MFDVTNYGEVPERTLETLTTYAQDGVPAGGFINAILINDLKGAIGRADKDNLKAIKQIVKFVCNQLPSICHGSPEKVKAWLDMVRKGKIAESQQTDRLTLLLNRSHPDKE